MCVQVETNNPRPSRQAAEALGVSGQTGQAVLQLLHVFRDHQILGFVRTGSVEHHYDQLCGVSLADLGQKLAHAHRVHLAAEFPVQFAFQGADRSVDINKLPLVSIADDRTQGCRSPAAFGADHPPEPGLVLKHQAHPPSCHGLGRQQGRQCFGKFFFHSAWTTAALLGCWVSGATLRHPCRASKRYTTEGATFLRPSRSARAARNGETTSTPACRAGSSQGARKACSSSQVSNARRRPPHFFRGTEGAWTPRRNCCCSRCTEARPTPSRLAVCSKVVSANAGNSTAWAAFNSLMSVVWETTCFAFETSFESMCRGLIDQFNHI